MASRASALLNFVPSGFVADTVVGSLPFATAVTFAPDGRLFIALKSGVVRVFAGGALLATPFIDLSAQVNNSFDRGLLGIAVHPNFPAQPYVYLLFTHDPPGTAADFGNGARVARLVRVEADPAQGFNVALPGMSQPQTTPGGPGHLVLLGTNSVAASIGDAFNGRDTTKASCMTGLTMAGQPIEDCIADDENSHSIGTVAFGSDGSLFVSSGDGSNFGGVDPRALRAQNLDSLSGKILRIDPSTGLGLPDNPFYDVAGPGRNRSKVWAFGLRNPFRIAIDPATNDPFIGDVGWNTWEEIDRGKGGNFGWPCYEGGLNSGVESGVTTSVRQTSYEASTATSSACASLYALGLGAVVAPTFTYKHSGTDGYGSTGGAAANAGAVYSGGTYPGSYVGALFIADYSRRWIRTLNLNAGGVATISNFAKESVDGIVQVLRGPDSNLYAVVYSGSGSRVLRIRYVAGGNTPPTAVASASPSSGSVPLDVVFSSTGSFDPDAQAFDFAWDFGDGAVATGPSPSHTFSASGTYVVTLTLTERTAPFASANTNVIITVGSSPPVATIMAPAAGATFAIGDVVTYTGSGAAGGLALPPSALSWDLRIHHNDHLHFDPLGLGESGTRVIDDHGDGVWYEFCLTATTPQSLVDTQCVSALPQQTSVTVDSNPTGALILYIEEGTQLPAPAILNPTVGSTRTISAPAIHQWRTFSQWDDGTATLSRQFLVGATPLSFSALYVNQPPSAAIAASSGAGAARFTFTFDATGSVDPEGGALSYAWDFGDGTAGAGTTSTHTYAAPGDFVATLTATDPAGGVSAATRAISIPQNLAPTAVASATPNSVATSAPVTFSGTNSTDSDGTIVASTWAFGDGATAASPTAVHGYASSGSYSATLSVTDDGGATASTTLSIDVLDPPGIAAQPVSLSVDPGQTATFSVVSTGSPPLVHQWRRDGIAISGATASSYTTPPVVPADDGAGFTVSIANPVGTAASAAAVLQVRQPPPPQNLAPVVDAGVGQLVTSPNPVALDGTVSDDGLPVGTVTVRWRLLSGPAGASAVFADAAAVDTTARFTDPGVYLLELSATDGSLQTTDTVTVTNVAVLSLSRFVTPNSDDAEQSIGGVVDLNSSDLELVVDAGSPQTVGLRFSNLALPPGAVIRDARVQFEVDEISTGAGVVLAVAGEKSLAPAPFTTAAFSLSSRPRTAATVSWTPPPWPTIQVAGADQRTPNLAAVVQEIVNQPGWVSGNPIALLVTGTGKRTAESANGTRAPVLTVAYESLAPFINQAPQVNAGVDQTIALPASAMLSGVVTDDGLPILPGVTSVQWTTVSGPGVVTFSAPTASATAATFPTTGTYTLRLTASDSALTRSDDVIVSVNALGVSTLIRAITLKTDDAEESTPGVVDTGSSDLELVTDLTPQTVGLRFPNITVPPGATILNARIQFEVDEVTTSPSISLTIAGQAAPNPTTFSTAAFGISSRSRTNAKVGWVPAPWPTVQVAGADQRTPNLAAVLQEIISQPGWASGNAVAFIVTGTGKRTAESANGTRAPVLTIDYAP